MSPCPRKLYHWRGLALGLFASFFCENPIRTVAWWESWKRGQKRLLVRCSFGFSRDFRILEMMGHAWSSVAGAEWSQPEAMRQTVYTLDSRVEEVRTSKLVRVQMFMMNESQMLDVELYYWNLALFKCGFINALILSCWNENKYNLLWIFIRPWNLETADFIEVLKHWNFYDCGTFWAIFYMLIPTRILLDGQERKGYSSVLRCAYVKLTISDWAGWFFMCTWDI